MKNILADYHHPLVVKTAKELTAGATTDREKLARLFYYVRDDIRFGFPLNGDFVKASETIQLGHGQCNTKSTLFLALCKALDIPARVHFSLIKKEIQSGLFTGFLYRMMPDEISHSWVEVSVDGRWARLDSFINDLAFYQNGKEILKRKGQSTGYSISCAENSSADLNLNEERFVQMASVTTDHGTWEEPAAYYATPQYKNRPSFMKNLVYRMTIGKINKRVVDIRSGCYSDLCG